MNRSIADIRKNLDYVGCDNATALELTMEIERQAAEIAELRAALAEIIASSPFGELFRRYRRDDPRPSEEITDEQES